MPFGPKVLLIKSPIAIAPTKEDWNKIYILIALAKMTLNSHYRYNTVLVTIFLYKLAFSSV